MVTLAELMDDASHAPWFVEETDKDTASEEYRQRVAIADLAKVAPAVIVWAVPNGSKRTPWEAGKAKREGMKAGTPDLTLAWPGGAAFAEFKSGKGKPSEAQCDMLDRLYRAGHHCGVFRTSVGLLNWLASIGAPVRIRGGSDANG